MAAGNEPNGHWTVLRRRVSLAGRVARGDGSPVSGGVVQLRQEAGVQPQAGGAKRTGPRSSTSADALAPAAMTVAPVAIETPIRRDGSYFFLDLSAGRYVTGGHDQRGRSIEAKAIDVPAADRARLPPLLAVDLMLEDTKALPAGRPP